MDFSNVTIGAAGERTWPAALGVSFAAGSSEDSVPVPTWAYARASRRDNLDADALIAGASGLGLSAIFGVSVIDQAAALAEREGHLPKPVVLMPGIDQPAVVRRCSPCSCCASGLSPSSESRAS